MASVFRIARVRGSLIGPPFHGFRIADAIWTGPTYAAECTMSAHEAPDPACQCGVWATPDLAVIASYAALHRQHDDQKVATIKSLARLPDATRNALLAEMVDQLLGPAGAELLELSSEAIERMGRLLKWPSLAVIRAEPDGEGEAMRADGAGRDPLVTARRRAMLQAFYRAGPVETEEKLKQLDAPDGYRRYHALTVRHIWLDACWADYRDELEQRYRCTVQLMRTPPGYRDWVDGLIATGSLPGWTPDRRAERRYRDQRTRELTAEWTRIYSRSWGAASSASNSRRRPG